MDTNRPVNLADTFISDPGWSYVDYLGEQVSVAGGIRIGDECAHFGSRQAARALRRKIEAILPDLEGPLVLDFAGVDKASSSFLDELVGRLAKKFGMDQFNEMIKIVIMHFANFDRAESSFSILGILVHSEF